MATSTTRRRTLLILKILVYQLVVLHLPCFQVIGIKYKGELVTLSLGDHCFRQKPFSEWGFKAERMWNSDLGVCVGHIKANSSSCLMWLLPLRGYYNEEKPQSRQIPIFPLNDYNTVSEMSHTSYQGKLIILSLSDHCACAVVIPRRRKPPSGCETNLRALCCCFSWFSSCSRRDKPSISRAHDNSELFNSWPSM